VTERPRILLVPALTELEWPIRPLLEEWAEVASYDAPGVGSESPAEGPRIEATAQRGLAEIDRRGWDRCVVAGDEFGHVAAVMLAIARPESVQGLVLGHACVEYRLTGPRPSLHPEIAAVGQQLIEVDFRTFVHQTLGIWDPGKVGLVDAPGGEALAEEYLERVPPEAAATLYEELLSTLEPAGAVSLEQPLRDLGVPLMLVQHEGCVFFTPEGFEEAVDAFPDAVAVSTPESPGMSSTVADALREFCEGLPE
jgi:pimeloyl-ACP methyl ester carboxylesterase